MWVTREWCEWTYPPGGAGRHDGPMTTAVVGAETKERLGYRPGLDALRAVAVALVVAAHLSFEPWRFGGRAGVTMFLTLSGFLITKLLLEEQDRTGRISRGGFYRRRAARLLPALPAVLIACALINHDRGFPVLAPLAASIFYVQNLLVGAGEYGNAFDHLWSLALEEQFYVVWPLVVAAVARERLLRVALWSVPIFLAVRVASWGAGWWEFAHGSGYSRVDGLLVGCGLAVWVHRHGAPRPPVWLGRAAWATVAVLAVGGGTFAGFANTVGFTLIEGATVVLVLAAMHTDRAPRPLVGLGKISYSVYLWHVPVMWLLLGSRGPLVTVAVTLWVAVVSYRFIEQPARRGLARRSGVPDLVDRRVGRAFEPDLKRPERAADLVHSEGHHV